jgi:hypothetical protein
MLIGPPDCPFLLLLQIQWLQQADDAWPLQQEVEGEVDAAYRFIIDREIEAPDRFQAIQSYRWVGAWLDTSISCSSSHFPNSCSLAQCCHCAATTLFLGVCPRLAEPPWPFCASS